VRRSLVLLALLLAVACGLAGCGGGGGSTLYTAQSAKTCLRGLNVKIAPATDFVATTATGGAFRAIFPDNSVTMVFGLTQADADNIADAYRRFRAKNVGIDDVLREDNNAVMLWHFHPVDASTALVGGCLKST
jgi:hypothetical protein